jgi:hypothetical protein
MMAEGRRLKRKTWLTAIVATAGIAGPTFGTIIPVGGELGVSLAGAYATGPAVAVAPSGAFTIVWQQYTDASAEWDVYRRRFDPGGTALDPSPVRVNTTTEACQAAPRLERCQALVRGGPPTSGLAAPAAPLPGLNDARSSIVL